MAKCRICPMRAVRGTLCRDHAARNRENQSRQYARAKANGACVICFKEAATRGVRCDGCTERMAKYQDRRVIRDTTIAERRPDPKDQP